VLVGPDGGVESSEELRFQLSLFRDDDGLWDISEESGCDLGNDSLCFIFFTTPELATLDVEPREPLGGSGGSRKYSRTNPGLFRCALGSGSKHSTGYSTCVPD